MAVGTVGRSWVVGGWFDYFIGWVAARMYVVYVCGVLGWVGWLWAWQLGRLLARGLLAGASLLVRLPRTRDR